MVEHLGDLHAVLIVDEAGFVEKGERSSGVQRQYSAAAGRVENCQVEVFLTYGAARGHTFNWERRSASSIFRRRTGSICAPPT